MLAPALVDAGVVAMAVADATGATGTDELPPHAASEIATSVANRREAR
jgi:hypothetical protein